MSTPSLLLVIKLDRAVVCPDCGAIFDTSAAQACPSCTHSGPLLLLARVLDRLPPDLDSTPGPDELAPVVQADLGASSQTRRVNPSSNFSDQERLADFYEAAERLPTRIRRQFYGWMIQLAQARQTRAKAAQAQTLPIPNKETESIQA